jgi:serine/threonine protein kinase/Tol biopolymer transport system component
MIGRTLAHYHIESKLGEGGMGAVYKARDTRLDRPVAIKVLSHDKVADPGRRQRFVLEAKAASALNHPNIVTIHDISADADGDFMVMEFIDGRTLDALIPRGGMPPARALKFAIQMADALTRAHHAGIVHRDLKPSNVMVTGNGLVKILDFGIAKLIEPVPTSPDAATRTAPQPLTEVGSVVGTAAYMSPEQVEGHQLDARSDIFSFGSVLYEMATAQTAFTGSSSLAIAARVLGEEPARPRRIRASISPELEGIILRCLQKDPGRRYQTMADLKVALEDAERTAIRGVSLRLPSWRWAGATVIPVLVAAGFIQWQAQRERPTPSAPTPPVALTTFPGMEFQPTLSPESTHVAFAWNGPKQDNVDIYVQQIGAGLPLRLTSDPLNDQNPVWSPDGRWIAFLRGRAPIGRALAGRVELRLIPPLGGSERIVTEVSLRAQPNVAHLTWCPDNSCLIVTDEQGDRKPYALFVVSLDSGEKRRLTSPPESMLGDLNPAVAPDGRSLVFQRFPSGAGAELHWVAVDERMMPVGESRRLTSTSLNAIHPVWMPEGDDILFSAEGRLWRQSTRDDGPASRLPYAGEDGLWPVVSRLQPGRAPRLVYARSFADRNIWRIDTPTAGAPSSTAAVSIASTRADLYAELSPSGRQVAFVSDRTGDLEIWIADLDGSNPVQLTSLAVAGTATPRWSPNGQTIVFNSNPEGQQEIYTIPATGGRPRRLTSHPANDTIPSFSRDGRWIYFTSTRGGGNHIWRIPDTGGDAVQITQDVGQVALEAPDGQSIFYTQTSGPEPSVLWRLSTTGGQPVKMLDGVIMRGFVVIERGIYYLDTSGGETRLQFYDFAARRSSTVAHNLGDVRIGLTASRDGRTIFYTRTDAAVDDLMLVENFR